MKPEQNLQQHSSSNIDKLNKKLAACKNVAQTLDTPGWKQTIEPIIEATILSTVGGKVNGRYTTGTVDRARKDEKKDYILGYRAAMMEYYNRIIDHVAMIPKLEAQIKQAKEDLNRKITTPMTEDRNPYLPEGAGNGIS